MFARLLPLLALLLLPLAAAQDDAVSALLSEASQVLETEDGLYLGIGNSVLRLNDSSGPVGWRKAVSGPVRLLEEDNGGVSVVTALPGGLSERVSLDARGRSSAPVRFGTDPAIFSLLREEAASGDPAERLEADPTNPWLYLAAADASSDPEEAAGYRRDALRHAATFYDLAALASEFQERGDADLAELALKDSLHDFVRRGYDARLLTDEALHAAYGFPLPRLREALDRDDAEAAAFHADWLLAFLAPDAPFVARGLHDYAAWLEARGDTAAAEEVREHLQPSREELAFSGVERLFLSVGRSGWFVFASLVTVILALQVTLTFKYWEPQSLTMRRVEETGGKSSFFQRFLAIRFFSTTEKLVLAMLYGAGLAVLGLTAWAAPGPSMPAAAGAGTLANAEAHDALEDLSLHGERGQFILGYAAQMSGLPEQARLHYRAAPRFGPALNNLGILDSDEELLREAASRAPALGIIRWNLDRDEGKPLFDVVAGLDRPVPLAPRPADFFTALHGSWEQALTSLYTAPARAFTMDVPWLPQQWLWYGLLGLYLLLGAVTLLWIIVPRPRLARNAPRSAAYHVLALLVPGSGLADEVWGILLLVPWGVFGVDLVWRLAGEPALLDLGRGTLILIVASIYAINLLAFIIEFISYSRRMKQLFRHNPEAGIAYGRQIEADAGRP